MPAPQDKSLFADFETVAYAEDTAEVNRSPVRTIKICTPGILVRVAAAEARGKTRRVDFDRALAAHLCRCTGWQTVYEAIEGAPGAVLGERDLDAAATRAVLEGGARQRVGPGVPLGDGGFADDAAPRDALVAVPRPPGSEVPATSAGGLDWVVAETLFEARALAGKVQGRRTTVDPVPPLELPEAVPGGVRLATGWVEPAYLEPDASWCAPGGEPATPLANGGAFGGKKGSPAPAAARELADATGRPVRVVYSREDVVRLGPKRPPIAAMARWDDGAVVVHGSVAGDVAPFVAPIEWPYDLEERGDWASHAGDRSADVERAAGGRLGRTRGVARGRAARGRSGPRHAPRRPSPRAVSLASCVAAPTRRARGGTRRVRRGRADHRGARARRRR